MTITNGVKVGEAFGRFTVVLSNPTYSGIWKATSAIATTKGDVARWKGGASGLDNIFVKGDIGTSISIKTKEISTDILQLLFGGTITTGANIGIFPPDKKKVPAAPGPYTITLSQTPASTALAVYGKLAGQKARFGYVAAVTAAGQYSLAVATLTVDATHAGQYIRAEYDYYSSTAKKWLKDPFFVPSPISGYFNCMWGGDQPSHQRAACVYFTDVYAYSPDFKLGANANELGEDNEVILECDEDSVIEVVFEE